LFLVLFCFFSNWGLDWVCFFLLFLIEVWIGFCMVLFFLFFFFFQIEVWFGFCFFFWIGFRFFLII
jgi:hypothetical protein